MAMDATPYRCTDCGEGVSLARTDTKQVIATCGCEDQVRMLKIATKTPAAWVDDEQDKPEFSPQVAFKGGYRSDE